MEVSIKGAAFEVQDEPADFWGWVKAGHYDKEWNLILAHLQPEHTFLDLGAWIGSHSLLASTIAKRVVAVEPDPIAYAILSRNLDFAHSPVEVFEMAIAGHAGVVRLGSGFLGASTTRRNPNEGGGIGRWEPGQIFSARCDTLRGFAEKHVLEDPLFIKMDVEGSEEEILDDVDFFREHKPVLFLERHPWWWKDESATRKRIEEISRTSAVISC